MENLINSTTIIDKKVVFFDIFDTIISRNIDPEYVKKVWAKRVCIFYNIQISYSDFYALRNKIEADCCKENVELGLDAEFKYSELVRRIYSILDQRELLNTDKIDLGSFRESCKEIELDLEFSVQSVDEPWIKLVKELKKNNILIYCISDFYLDSSMISILFSKHNIFNYIDKFYISSDCLLTKKSGRLFNKVIKENSLDPKDLFMIGDNKHSDYEMPISLGIDAYHLNRNDQHGYYKEFVERVESPDFFENSLNKLSKKIAKSDSFLEISFSFFYFISKLHEHLVRNGVKNVFFLSREGEFLIKLFNMYQQKEGFNSKLNIKAHYLMVSRKSTFLPSLNSLETEDFYNLFRQYTRMSVKDFLNSINFSSAEILRLEKRCKFDFIDKIVDFPRSDQFMLLKNDALFKELYDKCRLDQKNNFVKYINQFNVDIKEEGLHIVDVGWKGTIQDNIYNIFNQEITVSGYYLGLIASGNIQDNNTKNGILFSSLPSHSGYFNIYNENRALFEIVLGASHGSANQYIDSKELIEVETYQIESEKEIFEKNIHPLQRRIFHTFEELCDLFVIRSCDLNVYLKQFAELHARLILFPTKNEMNFFSQLYHYENFGTFGNSTFSKKENVSSWQSIKNLIQFIKSPRVILQKGFWGPLTLRNEGLGYLIPFYGRYKFNKNFNIKAFSLKNDRVEESIQAKIHIQEKQLQENKLAIKKMTEMIDDRDKAIKKMTEMIDDRDKAIKSMTKMIDERDEMLKNVGK